MNPRVKEVKPMQGFQLLLTFTNNESEFLMYQNISAISIGAV
jgi:hypothetical protein